MTTEQVIEFEAVSLEAGDYCTGRYSDTGRRVICQVERVRWWVRPLLDLTCILPMYLKRRIALWVVQGGIVMGQSEAY
jgi:hypothetical protein